MKDDMPKKSEDVVAPKKADVDVIVPLTEIVIHMAPAHFTREQVMDIIKQIDDARSKGLTVRFA